MRKRDTTQIRKREQSIKRGRAGACMRRKTPQYARRNKRRTTGTTSRRRDHTYADRAQTHEHTNHKSHKRHSKHRKSTPEDHPPDKTRHLHAQSKKPLQHDWTETTKKTRQTHSTKNTTDSRNTTRKHEDRTKWQRRRAQEHEEWEGRRRKASKTDTDQTDAEKQSWHDGEPGTNSTKRGHGVNGRQSRLERREARGPEATAERGAGHRGGGQGGSEQPQTQMDQPTEQTRWSTH